MKKVLIGVAVVVVLVVGALAYLLGSLDSIVQNIIEEVGTETTKTEVKLSGVSINLGEAKGSLSGLSIANPAGFSSNKAIAVGTIGLKLDANSLTSDTVVIKEIMIRKPTVNFEIGKSGNNFDAINKNIASSGGSSSSKSSQSDGPKLIIEHLYIKEGTITASSNIPGIQPLTTSLTDIHLKDIGRKSGGATAGEVARQVLSSLTKTIGTSVGKLDLNQLKGLDSIVKEKAGVSTDQLKDAGDKLKGLFK